MPRLLVIASLVSLAACTPHSAEIESGHYTAFMAVSSSTNVFRDSLNLDNFDEHWQIDCREDVDEDVLLPNRINVCDEIDDFEDEIWLGFDGYEVVGGDIDPWRGEAIMTTEGDLQLTFHQDLPGGDFRFAVAVDPKFQPKACVQGPDGEPQYTDVDGNWLQSWTAGDGTADPNTGSVEGTLFYLNAGAYQINPSAGDDIWILPDTWLAGYTQAKFGDEDMFVRTARYGDPAAYVEWEIGNIPEFDVDALYYVPMAEGTDPTTVPAFQAVVDEAREAAVETQAELAIVDGGSGSLTEGTVVRAETNLWRIADGNSAGLDGWAEIQYNWIRFDQPAADLTAGKPASGEFHLVYDAAGSQSKLFVTGTFTVDKIKKDSWTVPDLRHDTQVDNETEICGEPAVQPEE